MIRYKFFTFTLFLFIGLTVYAQQDSKMAQRTSMKTSVVPTAKPQTLLEEIFLIEDEKTRLENDKNISPAERSTLINDVNINYISKKQAFVSYVEQTGILHIPPKEQSYYLSLLKQDGKKEAYKKNIDLIKSSN